MSGLVHSLRSRDVRAALAGLLMLAQLLGAPVAAAVDPGARGLAVQAKTQAATNAGALTTLSGTVTAHTSSLATISAAQAADEATIAGHTTSIGANSANIATNASAIATAQGNLSLVSQRQSFGAIYALFEAGLAGAQVSNPHAAAVMASPPTVTFSTTTPSGPRTPPNSPTTATDLAPYMTTVGGWTYVAQPQFYCRTYTKTIGQTAGGSNSVANGGLCRTITMTADPSPSFCLSETQFAAFRILIDGQYTSLAGYTLPALNTVYCATIPLGSSKMRRIEIETQGASGGAYFTGSISGSTLTVSAMKDVSAYANGYVGQIGTAQTVQLAAGGAVVGVTSALGTGTGGTGTYTLTSPVTTASTDMLSVSGHGVQQFRYFYNSSPLYSFSAPPPQGIRWIHVADSYGDQPNIGMTAFSQEGDGFVRIAGDYLGIPDSWASGSPSTGYLSRSNSLNLANFLDRVTDVTNYCNANTIISSGGGVNDLNLDGQTYLGVTVTPAALQAQVALVLAGWRAGCPSSPIIVFGPVRFYTTDTTKVASYEAAIAAAVTARIAGGDKLITYVPTQSALPPWLSGSGSGSGAGTSYAPNGSGNGDIYWSQFDWIHLTFVGHAYFARRLVAGIMSGMEAIKAQVGLGQPISFGLDLPRVPANDNGSIWRADDERERIAA